MLLEKFVCSNENTQRRRFIPTSVFGRDTHCVASKKTHDAEDLFPRTSLGEDVNGVSSYENIGGGRFIPTGIWR